MSALFSNNVGAVIDCNSASVAWNRLKRLIDADVQGCSHLGCSSQALRVCGRRRTIQDFLFTLGFPVSGSRDSLRCCTKDGRSQTNVLLSESNRSGVFLFLFLKCSHLSFLPGGRRSSWVRSWTVWTYFRDYFPIRVSQTVSFWGQYGWRAS